VAARICAASVLAPAAADIETIEAAIAQARVELRRQSLVTFPSAAVSAVLRITPPRTLPLRTLVPWSSCNVALAASWALAAAWTDMRGVAKALDVMDEARHRSASNATAGERHRLQLAAMIVGAKGLLDEGYLQHAVDQARRARDCALDRLDGASMALDSTQQGLVVAASRVLIDALYMMGDSEGLLTDCAGGLQRLLACGSAIGTTTAPAAAAEDPMFAPANDLLSVGTGNAVANNDNVHSGTGHVEAALLHRFAVALASALNGRYAEAASTIESLTPIATSLCMTAFTTQCAAALLPLVLRLGRSLEQCLAALPLHQLPYRAAVDVLVAFATATATGSASVPSVAVADVGPGCASALERFAFLARHPQRLSADAPATSPSRPKSRWRAAVLWRPMEAATWKARWARCGTSSPRCSALTGQRLRGRRGTCATSSSRELLAAAIHRKHCGCSIEQARKLFRSLRLRTL
jgi:hypothetical protein